MSRAHACISALMTAFLMNPPVSSYLSTALKKCAAALNASGKGRELQADGVPVDVSLKCQTSLFERIPQPKPLLIIWRQKVVNLADAPVHCLVDVQRFVGGKEHEAAKALD
jgi:hypothetical protein